MKSGFKVIVFILLMNGCSMCGESNVLRDKLLGHWEVADCIPQLIHADITVPKSNITEIPYYPIKTQFSINFKRDHSFLFNDNEDLLKEGWYNITDSTLTLTVNDDELYWLKFDIDSINEKRLYMKSSYILFYSNKSDSINFFTGENVRIVLKQNLSDVSEN